jgi:hypothetical protein
MFWRPDQFTAHSSRYIAAERTWIYRKHISRVYYPASLLARRSYLQKHMSRDHHPLLWRSRGHGKYSLLYFCVLYRVYRAVAWKRVVQIRYNMYVCMYVCINWSCLKWWIMYVGCEIWHGRWTMLLQRGPLHLHKNRHKVLKLCTYVKQTTEEWHCGKTGLERSKRR